jgi:versiconal hemiacetal acetate esterase
VKTSEHQTANGIRLKSYKADTFEPNKPLIYYIHGGGFAMGSVDQDDRFLEPFSKATGCVFVSVEYRLAPKHQYPAALEDCVDGAKWCVKNAESLGAKKGPIVIFGKSAGGCLAFATALKLIDEGRGSDVLGVVPCQPITIHPEVVPEDLRSRYLSYDENAENTINTKKGMLAFMGKRTIWIFYITLTDVVQTYSVRQRMIHTFHACCTRTSRHCLQSI